MKLTLLLKLLPTPTQHATLLGTLERFNAACNAVAARAWESQTFNTVKLQTLVYRDVRDQFGLSAQMTVRAVGKVGDAYKRDKKRQPTFRPHGAMIYDERILSFKGLDTASLLTLQGRQLVKFIMGGYQRERIAAYGIRGQADLLYRDGTFYLAVVVTVPEPDAVGDDFLGVGCQGGCHTADGLGSCRHGEWRGPGTSYGALAPVVYDSVPWRTRSESSRQAPQAAAL